MKLPYVLQLNKRDLPNIHSSSRHCGRIETEEERIERRFTGAGRL